MSKYESTFAKVFVTSWSEEVFAIRIVKNAVRWSYVISDFNGEDIFGTFSEKELQKTN